MENIYESLCLELDTLLLDILENIEQYVALKVDVEKRMQSGFVNIAKTRYIKGSTSVSTMQLPTSDSTCDIQPLATVHRNEDKMEIKNLLSEIDGEKKDGLSIDGEKKEVLFNPLKLFGVLVPQSLRLAQTSFVSSIDRLGELASIQGSLDSQIRRYERLVYLKDQVFKKV